MESILCPSCGAKGTVGTDCEYCGTPLTYPEPEESADKDCCGIGSDTVPVYDNGISVIKVRNKVKSLIRSELSYSQSDGADFIYDVASVVSSFNIDIVKTFVPLYHFKGQYEGGWTSSRENSGNIYGDYSYYRLANKKFDTYATETWLEEELPRLSRYARNVKPQSIGKNDDVVLTPNITEEESWKNSENNRQSILESVARKALNGKDCQYVSGKFDNSTEIIYSPIWVIKVSIGNIKKTLHYLPGGSDNFFKQGVSFFKMYGNCTMGRDSFKKWQADQEEKRQEETRLIVENLSKESEGEDSTKGCLHSCCMIVLAFIGVVLAITLIIKLF